jgi:hypothetical protein
MAEALAPITSNNEPTNAQAKLRNPTPTSKRPIISRDKNANRFDGDYMK